jgi:HPt (histidine-containing phosphotransfer) domain-containing protein
MANRHGPSSSSRRFTATALSNPVRLGNGFPRDGDLVDRGLLNRLRQKGTTTGSNFFPQLVDLFLTDMHQRIATMSEALARGDTKALAQTAHALGGSGKIFGAKRVAQLCGTLQQRDRPASLAEANRILRQLRRECDRVDRILEAEKAKP